MDKEQLTFTSIRCAMKVQNTQVNPEVVHLAWYRNSKWKSGDSLLATTKGDVNYGEQGNCLNQNLQND